MLQATRVLGRRTTARLVAAAVPFVLPAAVLAQGAPPEPKVSGSPPVWIGYAFMFLLLAVLVSVSLMPSKRAHQD